MTRYLVILLFGFSLAPLSAITFRIDEVEEISRLENEWNEAHLNGDASALSRLWSDDLVVTVPNMSSMDKTQSLAIWKSGRFKFQRYETENVRIRVYGDAAVVTGRLQRTRTIGEKKLEDDWLYTKTYVRSEKTWKVVAFHASPAPEEAQ